MIKRPILILLPRLPGSCYRSRRWSLNGGKRRRTDKLYSGAGGGYGSLVCFTHCCIHMHLMVRRSLADGQWDLKNLSLKSKLAYHVMDFLKKPDEHSLNSLPVSLWNYLTLFYFVCCPHPALAHARCEVMSALFNLTRWIRDSWYHTVYQVWV